MLAEQLHVGFVDDCGRLGAVMPPFPRQLPRGQRVELVVDERDEPLKRVLAAVLPLVQQTSDPGGCFASRLIHSFLGLAPSLCTDSRTRQNRTSAGEAPL